MGHQTPLLVRAKVMRSGISGKSRKISYVILSEGPGPRKRFAWFHGLILKELEQAVWSPGFGYV
jgi:hypothetical protein